MFDQSATLPGSAPANIVLSSTDESIEKNIQMEILIIELETLKDLVFLKVKIVKQRRARRGMYTSGSYLTNPSTEEGLVCMNASSSSFGYNMKEIAKSAR